MYLPGTALQLNELQILHSQAELCDLSRALSKTAQEKRYRRKTPRQLAQEAIFDAMWASGSLGFHA